MHRNLDQFYTNTNILFDELVNNIVKYTMLLICVERGRVKANFFFNAIDVIAKFSVDYWPTEF